VDIVFFLSNRFNLASLQDWRAFDGRKCGKHSMFGDFVHFTFSELITESIGPSHYIKIYWIAFFSSSLFYSRVSHVHILIL